MYHFLIVLHVVVCTFLVLVVLLQAGKGGGMGIAFGGGGSQTVFGGSGAGNIFTKLTAIAATIFILNSLTLAYLSSQSDSTRLQELAAEKAAAQKSEEAAKARVIEEVEKAREDLAKQNQASSGSPETTSEGAGVSTEGAAAPEGATAPAEGTAPEGTAPEGAAPEAATAPAEGAAPEGTPSPPASEPEGAAPTTPSTESPAPSTP